MLYKRCKIKKYTCKLNIDNANNTYNMEMEICQLNLTCSYSTYQLHRLYNFNYSRKYDGIMG